MAYRDVVLVDTPLDFYEMETATGTDSGSGARTLTKTGITTGVAGRIGNGWSFNGTSDYATMGTFPTITTAFTIEAWMKAPSAGGWTTDYPTVVRRDGTDIVLVRGRGSALGVSPGEVDIYLAGTSFQSGPTNRVDDGNWHHVVLSVAGNQAKLYIDNVLISTTTIGKSSYSFGTGTAYVGAGNTAASAPSELYKGMLDSVAIYNTALSATRIAAHYNAAPVNMTYDATTVTMNFAGITEAFAGQPVNSTITLPTVGISIAAVEIPKRTVLTPNRDAYSDQANTPNYSIDTFTINVAAGLLMDYELPSDYLNSALLNAELSVRFDSMSAGTVLNVYAVTAEYTNGTIVHSLGTPITYTFAGTNVAGYAKIDVSSLMTKPFYGLYVRKASGFDKATFTSESAYTPSLALDYTYVPFGDTVDVDTASLNLDAKEATAIGGAVITVDTVTASLSAYDVTVEDVVNPNVDVTVETVSVALAAIEASVSQVAIVELSGAADGITLDAKEATVENTSSPVIDLDTPSFIMRHVPLTDVNGQPIVATEEEDKFFVSTKAFLDFANTVTPRGSGSTWFRMNETGGSVAVDRLGRWTGSYSNVQLGGVDGPNGRNYARFNGNSWFRQIDNLNNTDEVYAPNGSLELAIRTTKADQFIIRMDDTAYGSQFSVKQLPRDLYLVNGKLVYRVWLRPLNTGGIGFEQFDAFTGFTNLADGEWHNISLSSKGTQNSLGLPDAKITVYVDGNLEIRRDTYGLSFPDYAGGREGFSNLEAPYKPLQQSEWFVGDMSEVVFFNGILLNQDDVSLQNDNLFGYDPVYVQSAKMTFKSNDVIIKTDVKRVLTLNFRGLDPLRMSGGTEFAYAYRDGAFKYPGGGEDFKFSGLAYAGSTERNGVLVNGYQVFQYDIMGKNGSTSNYYDNITDTPRLIDLQVDVNLEDYEIINVINYPNSGRDYDLFDFFDGGVPFGRPNGRQQLENLIDQIKQYAIDGGGVYVTDPGTAVALGIINDVKYVSGLRELRDLFYNYGVSAANYDWRAATINPWGNNPGAPITTTWTARQTPYPVSGVDYEQLAHFYDDQHANNKQRVIELVDGLTDIPGRILTESVAFWSYKGDGEMVAEKWKARDNGLDIGDEFWTMGTPLAGRGAGWNNTDSNGGPTSPFSRARAFPAAPISAVKAGTVVTAFANTLWVEHEQIANPYRDYAISVVVQPGDILDGQVMQGKIYMNFTESFAELGTTMMHGTVDVIPPNSEMTRGEYYETTESRDWEYSSWRGSWGGLDGSQRTEQVLVQQPDGSILIKDKISDDNIVGISYTNRWPSIAVDAPTMHYRGLKWLSQTVGNNGDATVGIATAVINVKANDVIVETKTTTEVTVPTARMTFESYDDQDAVLKDVTVLVSTPTVILSAVAFTEEVTVETARITFRANDDLDGILANADLVVLRLPTPTAILTLEER